MTPAEACVIETAIRYMNEGDPTYTFTPLAEAVEALESERAEFREYTWGQLTEGDQVYSEVKRKWYLVERAVRNDIDSMVTVNLQGQRDPVVKYLGQACRVKRGATGQAVDIVQVIFSGEVRQ